MSTKLPSPASGKDRDPGQRAYMMRAHKLALMGQAEAEFRSAMRDLVPPGWWVLEVKWIREKLTGEALMFKCTVKANNTPAREITYACAGANPREMSSISLAFWAQMDYSVL